MVQRRQVARSGDIEGMPRVAGAIRQRLAVVVSGFGGQIVLLDDGLQAPDATPRGGQTFPDRGRPPPPASLILYRAPRDAVMVAGCN